MTKKAAAAKQENFPLLYNKPVILSKATHQNLRLNPNVTYSFAKNTNSMPINGAEFRLACTEYPIVFNSHDGFPIAIVGIESDKNAFVDENGKWNNATYIPAYARRYPFIFADTNDKFTLCIDEESGFFVNDNGQPLFENGEATSIVQEALKFCEVYHSQYLATKQFADAIKAKGLLVERGLQFDIPKAESIKIGGFSLLDEEKLAKSLTDAELVEWAKKGWIAMIACQVASQNNWRKIANMRG